jgi:hypothetical protein
MKRFKQFRPTRTAILVCTMALTACAGLSSRNVLPEPERAGDHASDASLTGAQSEAWRTACGDRDGATLGSNLSSCMAIPSTWDEGGRVASGYFYGIDCCGQNRVALTPVLQAPAVSSPARTPYASEAVRVGLMQVVFQFATQP